MRRHVVRISAEERLSTVEDIMTLGKVRHMPVVRGGELVGVVSERDLLRASLSNINSFGSAQRRAFLHAVEITRVMSEPPIVIDPDATVEQAARVLAEHKIGCLPVVAAGGALIGLLTETDVLCYFAERVPDANPRKPSGDACDEETSTSFRSARPTSVRDGNAAPGSGP
ncbi:MAG: CBS domain-containing protein [Myxococcota bacterium]